MMVVRREFNVWLYARSDHFIDALLLDEPRTWDYVKRLVVDGKVTSMLDVGAHIGGYAVVLGRKIHVFAMEPMPDTFAMLNLNVKLNKVNVETVRAAAYDGSCSTVRLRRSLSHSGGDHISSAGGIKAPAYTLDDIWMKYGPFDLVKIDVEGSEGEVLRGFSRIPKYLVVEVRPSTWKCVKEFLLTCMQVAALERLVRGNAFNVIAKKYSNLVADCGNLTNL